MNKSRVEIRAVSVFVLAALGLGAAFGQAAKVTPLLPDQLQTRTSAKAAAVGERYMCTGSPLRLDKPLEGPMWLPGRARPVRMVLR